MKLYYAPHACSLSPHIVLRELGLSFDLVKVDNRTRLTADGRDFRTINPKGYVAALELDDGQVLTDGPAIVQYLADLDPESRLAPRAGTWERVRLQEWLNFVATEIHAGSAPLFNTALPEEALACFRTRLSRVLSHYGVRRIGIDVAPDADAKSTAPAGVKAEGSGPTASTSSTKDAKSDARGSATAVTPPANGKRPNA